MIIVTGATGNIGGEVARQLIAAGHRPRLIARHLDSLQAFSGSAELVRGDLSNPQQLVKEFAGGMQLFLMSPGIAGGYAPEIEIGAIDAARRAGIKHVVKLSAIGAEAPVQMFSRWHAASERALMESGLSWTMLRPGSFMSNTLHWATTIRSAGVFHGTMGDGRLPMIDPADIGTAAVNALTQKDHEGRAYTLTGPEAHTASEHAAILSAATGRSVTYVDVPAEEMAAQMRKAGLPEELVAARLDMMNTIKKGLAERVIDPSALLGRPAGTFAAWVTRNASAFR